VGFEWGEWVGVEIVINSFVILNTVKNLLKALLELANYRRFFVPQNDKWIKLVY